MTTRAVLSISSRVVRGYVGNSAASFALQRMGIEVLDVPTLIWNHHPGLGRPGGLVIPAADLAALLDRFCTPPWAHEVGTVITGYLADAGQARVAAQAIARLKRHAPDVRYICDPVSGDAAGPYVKTEVIDALRHELVPLADVLTPNRFELDLLVGRRHADNRALAGAARSLGRASALVTSAFASRDDRVANLLVFSEEAHCIETLRHPHAPHGTGDLMTALLAGHTALGRSMTDAAALAAAAVADVVAGTRAGNEAHLGLIESQECLVRPRSCADAYRL